MAMRVLLQYNKAIWHLKSSLYDNSYTSQMVRTIKYFAEL